VKTSKLWINTWNQVVTENVKQIKIYLRCFKVATIGLMTALHTLGSLSTSFTWNAFPTVLKEFFSSGSFAAI
jgi:hypothetical protein